MDNYSKSFEEFIEDTWDYVSRYVVSDEYWEKNNLFIREVSFELYEIYRKNLIEMPDGTTIEKISVKECGKILESFFAVLNNYYSTIEFPEEEKNTLFK